jgi:UPF0271 protein
LSDVDTIVARSLRLALAGEVETAEGTVVPCVIESLCVHGDTPGAVELARRIRSALTEAGAPPTPFA